MSKVVKYGKYEVLSNSQKGNKELLVVFHTGVGNLSTYTDLIPYLRERNEEVATFTLSSVEDFLNVSYENVITETGKIYGTYLASLNKDKYKLMGHCIGGLFTLEAAKVLKKLGKEVENVILIDNTVKITENRDISYITNVLNCDVILERMFGRLMNIDLNSAGYLIDDNRMNEVVEYLSSNNIEFNEENLADMKNEFQDVGECYQNLLSKNHKERLDAFCHMFGEMPYEQFKYQRDIMDGMYALFKHSINACLAYIPPMYNEKVTVLICEQEVSNYYLNTINVFSNQKEAWENILGEKAEYIYIPGDHFSCLQKPLVNSLIEILKGM